MWFRRHPPAAEMPPSRDYGEIRLKVLDESEFGTALYELLGPVFYGQGRKSRQLYPHTPLEETRAVVLDLLEAGHIRVVAVQADGGGPLDLEPARRAVAEDRNWLWPGPQGVPVIFEVAITDSGEDEWAEMVQPS